MCTPYDNHPFLILYWSPNSYCPLTTLQETITEVVFSVAWYFLPVIVILARKRIFKRLWSPGIDSKEWIPPSYVACARICRRLRRPGIDSEESVPPAYLAWRAGTTSKVVVPAYHAGNRFLGSFRGLQILALAGRYDNPIPPRYLAPIDSLKIPAQVFRLATDIFLYLCHVCLKWRQVEG